MFKNWYPHNKIATILVIKWSKLPLNCKFIISINICGNSIVIQNPPPTLVNCLIKHVSQGIYNNTCAFDFSNPKDNISNWKTGDKIHIDDNFLTQLLIMGYSYSSAKLSTMTSRKKNPNVSWALPYISDEAKLARYFVENALIISFVCFEPLCLLFDGS